MTPATVTRYDAEQKRVTDTSRNVRRTRRRNVLWLWVRIVFAAIWAVIWTARMVILILVVIAVLGVAGYYYGPSVIRVLSRLAVEDVSEDTAEGQVTPLSQASPATVSPAAPNATPQTSPPKPPPMNGTNVPSKGPR
jgi:hypothetical protein